MQTIKKLNYKVTTTLLATALYFTAIIMPWKANAQDAEFGLPTNVQPKNTESDIFQIFQLVANIMLAVIGAVAVIMLIVGGFRYVVSGGDSSAVESAKNTILYAIIGIVVAFLAYAAINFLIDNLKP